MTDEELLAEGARCGHATVAAQEMLTEAIKGITLGDGYVERIMWFFVGYMETLNLKMQTDDRRAFLAGIFAGMDHQGLSYGARRMVDDLMDRVEEKLKSRQASKGALQ